MPKANVLLRSKKAKIEALIRQNQLDAAYELAQSLCRAHRNDVELWTLLSLLQRKRGQYHAAEQAAAQAVQLRPNFAAALQMLGMALHCQGQLEAACSQYEQVLRVAPNQAEVHYLLGNAQRERGALQAAEASYARALAIQADFLEALSNRGATLIALDRAEEALACLQRANELRPGVPQVLCNLAQILTGEGRFEAAKGYCRQALQRMPDFIDALALLADLEEKTHADAAAAQCLERGLALAPDNITLNMTAARLARRQGQATAAIERLEALRTRLPEALQADILLLLGQLYDQQNDPDRAFTYLTEGNRLKAERLLSRGGDDSAHYLSRVEAQRQLFRAEPAQTWQQTADSDGEQPIFLLGFPRSGTTLLEQILDAHPRLQALEEKPTLAAAEQAFNRLTAGRTQPYGSLQTAEIEQLRATYFAAVQRHLQRDPKRILVDKMPLNTVQIPLIWRLFPRAKIILAVRHPCDACFSCFMQDFALNHALATFFSLQKTAEAYAGVMSLWREYSAVIPLDYHRIRYEDLVADSVGETRRLLAFLELEWDDSVLRHTEHARGRAIRTPSYHQVRQPIYQHAKYRWTRYAQQLAPILPLLQPYIDYFGYGSSDAPTPT